MLRRRSRRVRSPGAHACRCSWSARSGYGRGSASLPAATHRSAAKGRACVTEIMKPHPIEAGPRPDGVPRAVHVPRLQRTALVGREHETGVSPCCASGEPVSVLPPPVRRSAARVCGGTSITRRDSAVFGSTRTKAASYGAAGPVCGGGLSLGRPVRRTPGHTLHVSRLGLAHMAGGGIVAPPSSLVPDCPVRGRRVWGGPPGRHRVMASPAQARVRWPGSCRLRPSRG